MTRGRFRACLLRGASGCPWALCVPQTAPFGLAAEGLRPCGWYLAQAPPRSRSETPASGKKRGRRAEVRAPTASPRWCSLFEFWLLLRPLRDALR